MENVHASVALEILTDDGRRIVVAASHLRHDVRDAGFGSGYHGFAIDTHAIASSRILIRFLDSQHPVSDGFIDLDPAGALAAATLPPTFLSAVQTTVDDIEQTARQQGFARATSWGGAWRGGKNSSLLEPLSRKHDPEGLITAFLAQEALRCGYPRAAGLATATYPERLDALFWYLSRYGRERPGVTLPLSDQQLFFLNTRADVANISPAVTNALLNFVLSELPEKANLLNATNLIEVLYWWCVERPVIKSLDPRLVTSGQIDVLLTGEPIKAEPFALTSFTRRFYERHGDLHELDVDVDRDRAALLFYLVLHAVTHPWIIRLLPKADVRMLLRASHGGSPIFDEVLKSHLAGDETRDIGALRAAGDALLRGQGYAPLSEVFSTREAVEVLRPSVDGEQHLGPGVTLVGSIRRASGLSQAARLSARILSACETTAPAVFDFDIEVTTPVSMEAVGHPPAPCEEAREISILHLNADIIPQAFAFLPGVLPAASYKIGICVWELDKLPDSQRLALSLLDEVWVPSEYCRRIFAEATAKPVVNVGMAVPPIADRGSMSRAAMGIDPDAFVFLASFDSFSFIERKNPLAAIHAFAQAFPPGRGDVRLVLKTHNRQAIHDRYQIEVWSKVDMAIAADPRIILIDETFRHDDLIDFKRGCDCYLSLHRAEGFGFGILEAMQIGLPVIATAYSGNMDFCCEETCFLVPFRLVEAEAQHYLSVPEGSRWADPDIACAARHMREIVADPSRAGDRIERAKRMVTRSFSIEAIAGRYAERLAAIRGRAAGSAATIAAE